ncbi:MLX-interacting protein [Schistocerca gregaria]|uniref:MLX-interacting protein n=1 Tax=Schistocerca gregaria TaxID=7010 RepID=UPI00211DD94B|nr:MLX-interacting protein [Schistocerca gregaria]
MQCSGLAYRKVYSMTQGADSFGERKKKPEKEAIHSGHFMVSDFEAEAQDDEFNVAVALPEEENKTVAVAISISNTETFISANRQEKTQQVSIETSLAKLFQCMSLAYRQKLTSPKWNRFKGIRLRWKDKIRLNNVIWRCWHMQFIRKQNTLVCQFASPLDVDTHNKPEAVVLEGKYWKRKLAAVTAEYKKWRMFYRNRLAGWSSKDGNNEVLSEADIFDWQPHSNDSMHSVGSMMVDEDYMEFMSDTLFTTISANQPYAFPDQREIARGAGLADFIQPSLVQLQPNLDDFMDTFEPLQELLSYSKLPAVPEESTTSTVFDSASNTSGVDVLADPLAGIPTATYSSQQQDPVFTQGQPVSLTEKPPTTIQAFCKQEAQPPIQRQVITQPQSQQLLDKPLPYQQQQRQQPQLPLPQQLQRHQQQQTLSQTTSYQPAHPHQVTSRSNSVTDCTLFAVPKENQMKAVRTRSRSGPNLLAGVNRPSPPVATVAMPQTTSQEVPAVVGASQGLQPLLLAQLLSNTPSANTVFNFTAAPERPTLAAQVPTKQASSILPALPVQQQSSPATLLITTAPTQVVPTISMVSPCKNSPSDLSSPLGTSPLGSPQSPPYRSSRRDSGPPPKEHRRMCHINAEQKRRCNIKNGFDMLHSLIPQLNQNPNAKLSKAAMLQKGAEYIQQLRAERDQLREEMLSLRQEIECLNASISNCQALLPATGAPVSRQRTSKMKEMFDEYVRIRTLENWKFWIFSILFEPLLSSYTAAVSTASLDDLYRSTLLWVEQHCSLVELRPGVLNSLRYLSRATDILTDPARLPEEARRAVLKRDMHL